MRLWWVLWVVMLFASSPTLAQDKTLHDLENELSFLIQDRNFIKRNIDEQRQSLKETDEFIEARKRYAGGSRLAAAVDKPLMDKLAANKSHIEEVLAINLARLEENERAIQAAEENLADFKNQLRRKEEQAAYEVRLAERGENPR